MMKVKVQSSLAFLARARQLCLQTLPVLLSEMMSMVGGLMVFSILKAAATRKQSIYQRKLSQKFIQRQNVLGQFLKT